MRNQDNFGPPIYGRMMWNGGNGRLFLTRGRRLVVLAALLLLAGLARCSAVPVEGDRGLWLLPRKDACNTARADVAGNMKTAPIEAWSYGIPDDVFSYLKRVQTGGKAAFFGQVRNGLRLVRADGSVLWNRPTVGVATVLDVIATSAGTPAALATTTANGFVLVDVSTGKTIWEWSVPDGSYLGGYRLLKEKMGARLVVFPQNSMRGFCFEIGRHPMPRLLWSKDYTGRYWQNFGPFFVLADMDNDKVTDIVLAGKPGYVGVLDIDTGAVKFDLKYEISGGKDIGRPYGLIHAVDIDTDGFRDVVVVGCQVEEYLAVLRNVAGKQLELLWSKFVGLDFPVEKVKLRPNTTSVADVNGDGKCELVLSMFNETGDGRWHTIVLDPTRGFSARLADLPDRYFWGCLDLDGDSSPEIITSVQNSEAVSGAASLRAVDGRTFADIAAADDAAVAGLPAALPLDTAYHATATIPNFPIGLSGRRGLLVSRQGKNSLWRLSGRRSVFEDLEPTSLEHATFTANGGARIEKAGVATAPGDGSKPVLASAPLVSQYKGRRELILSLSNGTVIGGKPDLGKSGEFASSWTVPGMMPSVWIGPDGDRLVCTVNASGDTVSCYRPSTGSAAAAIASVKPSGTVNRASLSRSTASLLPFGRDAMRLFVGLRLGAHAMASAVYDSRLRTLWSDSADGPYPRIAAAADLNADGREEVVMDNHGRHIIHDDKGASRLVAAGWSDAVPGRSDGAKYAVPVVGPFGPAGSLRIVMAGGLDALETLDAAGGRIGIRKFASTYEFQWCGPAVARVRRSGEWDVGTIDTGGVFHCSDTESCATRWVLDLGARSSVCATISAGDVDGDGSDNFLVALPDGRLVVLDERNGKGAILWQMTFDAGVTEAMMADVDGDGLGEIIATLDDGRVKVLKAAGKEGNTQ